ncbi:MAG TPA: extensin family protein [Methylobacterium sp.]|jgi:hypothetical protein
MALRRTLAGIAALAALTLGAEAQERPTAPSAATPLPTPPQRPDELKPQQPEAPKAPDAVAAEMPQPPPRPPELSGEAALPVTVPAPDDLACRRRLERLGATFETLPPIANGQCGAAKPLKVTALAGIALPTPVILVCGAAEAMARWAVEVQVAAERDLGHPLASLSIGTSYECRGQNHDRDARLSEHAVANGIDVMGYGFTGRGPIGVVASPSGTPEATFQSAIRAKACGLFRTVLGPGSDAAHANHLHLDERERTSGHRLCQ